MFPHFLSCFLTRSLLNLSCSPYISCLISIFIRSRNLAPPHVVLWRRVYCSEHTSRIYRSSASWRRSLCVDYLYFLFFIFYTYFPPFSPNFHSFIFCAPLLTMQLQLDSSSTGSLISILPCRAWRWTTTNHGVASARGYQSRTTNAKTSLRLVRSGPSSTRWRGEPGPGVLSWGLLRVACMACVVGEVFVGGACRFGWQGLCDTDAWLCCRS